MQPPNSAEAAGQRYNLSRLMTYLLKRDQLSDGDRILLFVRDRVLIRGQSVFWNLEDIDSWLTDESDLHLVSFSEQRCLALDVPESLASQLQAEDHSLRSLIFSESDASLATVGKANQILDWYQSHRYCGRCGHPTRPREGERALQCNNCERTYYPRINPCIIVLVTDGDKILLARNMRYRGKFLSCLAGFIEVGESAEQTVCREVQEEVGIQVKNVRYVKSQSWPFPSQLMLGFYADYAAGDLRPDGIEIDYADWFDVRDLPEYPSPQISVAGQLISGYIASRLPDQ
jgi:NAD+ diphosphatase